MLENASNSSSLVRQPFAQRSRNQRSKITNRPNKMVIDGRTPLGRRLRDIADQLAAGLGGWSQLNELQAGTVRKAAELLALSEDARARRLNGDVSIALDDLVRLDRLAAQAVKALGLDHKREPPSAPDLRTYLAGLKTEETASPVATASPEPETETNGATGDAARTASHRLHAHVGDVVEVDGTTIEIVDE